MDKADSFMNWGFKPQNSVDELYYSSYKYWSEEANLHQSPAVFKPFDENPLKFIEKQIKDMLNQITETWDWNFEDIGYCQEILLGNIPFPIQVYYKEKKNSNTLYFCRF